MLKQEELNNIKTYDCLCELLPTKINGVSLDYTDFGEKCDIDEENTLPYCCADMQFIPYEEIKQETLSKYNITEQEYRQIQEKLNCLSFGCCGWCE